MQSYGKPLPTNGTTLLRFKKKPDCEELRYYKGIRRAIAARLQAEVEAYGRDPNCSLSLSPELLGETEQEATLHVMVCCAPYLEEVLNKAFASESFQSLLTVPRSNMVLSYLVIPDAPKFLNAQLDIKVSSQKSYVTSHGTHCGASISFRGCYADEDSKLQRLATFGGIIKVTYGNGEVCYYGMTAGHVISTIQRPNNVAGTNASGENDVLGLVRQMACDHVLGHALDPQQLPGVSANRAELAYDWSLFEVSDPQPNQAVHPHEGVDGADTIDSPSHRILLAQHPHFEDDTLDPVLLLGAVARTRRGELSNVPASLWLAHNQHFVDAYMLEMYNGSEVFEGDSGAWVVHAAASELYGHVAATNVFGDAYVLPAVDTFENIRQCLGATSVSLPSLVDLPVAINTKKPPVVSDLGKKRVMFKGRRDVGQTYICSGKVPRRSARALLNRTWPDFPGSRYKQNDTPHWESDLTQSSSVDLIEDWVAEFESRKPSWAEGKVRRFFREAKEDIRLRNKDHSPNEHHTEQPGIREPCSYSERPAIVHRDPPSGSRPKLIRIHDLSVEQISVALRNCRKHEAEGLYNLAQLSIESETTLRVDVSVSFVPAVLADHLIKAKFFKTDKSPRFQLDFHVRYHMLVDESSHGLLATGVAKLWNRVPCSESPQVLDNSDGLSAQLIYEAHECFTIVGFNRHDWTVLSLSQPRFLSNDKTENKNRRTVGHGDDENGTAIKSDDGSEDLSVDSHYTELMGDPRMHFLQAAGQRLQVVVGSYEHLARSLGARFTKWTTQNPSLCGYCLQGRVQMLTCTMKMLKSLRQELHTTMRAWSRFRGDGDLLYFADLRDSASRESLCRIEEAFEKLFDIGQSLDLLENNMKASMAILQLYMTQVHELDGASKKPTSKGADSDTERAGGLAFRSILAAEETSRTTRVNVQLLIVTTLIVIALQYFCSDRALFAFERNKRTFYVCVVVLIPSLLLLGFALLVIDEVRNILFAHLQRKTLQGKTELIVTPPKPEPISSV